MAPNDPMQFMDNIFQHVTTTPDPQQVAQYLRNLSPKEARDTALASPLSSGQDPLTVLHPTQNTLAMLYILVARLTLNGAAPPHIDLIAQFCRLFDPVQARMAPNYVTALARGIQRHATAMQTPRWAIAPLRDLLSRYPPDSSYLTAIHPIFTLVCIQATNPMAAVGVLSNAITNVDTNLSELTYHDNLNYHYTGGIIFAMLKRWAEAAEYFEIAVTAPGTYPAGLQMEALKKLRLVQLIHRGKISQLPKYTHPLLLRQFKASPYAAFINHYPHNAGALHELLHKERNTFAAEKNVGLLRQAMERAPRWELKKLTATYLSLGLADIAAQIRLDGPEPVRALLLSMIADGDVAATISADGSVTFSDPPPEFSRAQVDRMLKDVQGQAALLEHLDREMGRSKEYLAKAVKGKESEAGPGGNHWVSADPDDMFMGAGTSAMSPWEAESAFA